VPRPIWSGAISFGLVNVPVKLYSATSSKDVRFHQLDGKSKSRIKQKRVSVATGEEVPYEDIVKAYEIAPDNYVTIAPEELDALDPKATKTIDIEDFVDLDQIDPVYYERPYYLVPDKGGQKAYALLRNAMRETNKVGIARVVLRTKQYLAAIRPKDDALVMETMLFADEVNPLDELDLPGPDVDVTEREEKMARSVTSTSGPGRSSSSRGLTSSANSMVSMTSASSNGRMAARYCLVRRTTRAMPTLLVSRMALRSRA